MTRNNAGKKATIECKVSSDRGKLRISIPAILNGGKRRYLSTGLSDTPVNRALVEQTASTMSADIILERFDYLLSRYKFILSFQGLAEANRNNYKGEIPGVDTPFLLELFDKWTKSLGLSESTFNNKYKPVRKKVETANPLWNETEWIHSMNVGESTFNSYTSYLRRCVNWALEEELIEGKNPYKGVWKKIEKNINRRKGFTEEEESKILEYFESCFNSMCQGYQVDGYYFPMVSFWFCSGLRVGEVIALKWKDISRDWAEITIQRSLSRDHSDSGGGHFRREKETKTGLIRKLPITAPMEIYLKYRESFASRPDNYIFTTCTGGAINPDSWRRTIWSRALREAGVPYQAPKNIRHTLLSKAVNDPEIGLTGTAYIAGHTTTKTIQENYLGHLRATKLPSSDR